MLKNKVQLNIGILEFLYHEVFLYTLIKLVHEYNVTVFTTERVFNNISFLLGENDKRIKWIFREKEETLDNFLRRVNEYSSKSIDLLFVNTLQGDTRNYLTYYFLNPKCKKLLVTARYEEWFCQKYSLLHPIRDDGHNFQLFFRKRILNHFDGIIVHTLKEKEFLLSKKQQLRIFVIPYTLTEKNNTLANSEGRKNDTIKFGITGAIDDRRRDYDFVLKIVETFTDELKSKFALYLIGRPVSRYGNRIISKCKELKRKGFNIVWFENYIEEKEYVFLVKKMDFLISPIKTEYYTLQGYTSAVVDSIRFLKPVIFPKNYDVLDEVKSISLFYENSEDLKLLISSIILNESDSFNKSRFQANLISQNFSIERWQKIINVYVENIFSK